MSSYVRKKAVRYKFDDNIVKELKKEIEDNKLRETEEELLEQIRRMPKPKTFIRSKPAE